MGNPRRSTTANDYKEDVLYVLLVSDDLLDVLEASDDVSSK